MEIVGSIRDHIPLISISFYGADLEVCVDTGFNGALLIPQHLAERYKLKYVSDMLVMTAAGEQGDVFAYEAELSWLGRHFLVDVLAMEECSALLGMQLLHETRLEMEPAKGLLRISST